MKKRLPWALVIILSVIVLGQVFYTLKEHGERMIIHLYADSAKHHCQFGFAVEYNFLGQAVADGGGAPIQCDERVELVPRVWVRCYCPASDDKK